MKRYLLAGCMGWMVAHSAYGQDALFIKSGASMTLAPGALVLSDLPLTLPDCTQVPLPEGARVDRYYMYRHKG